MHAPDRSLQGEPFATCHTVRGHVQRQCARWLVLGTGGPAKDIELGPLVAVHVLL